MSTPKHRGYVVYSSWFSYRQKSHWPLLRFGTGGRRFLPRVAAAMNLTNIIKNCLLSEGEGFCTPPPPPLNFLDISLPPSKRGEEQTVIFGNDLVYINQCMILTCLCQRKSGTFRRWGRLSVSSGDSLCFSAQWWRWLRRAGILTGWSLRMEGCVYSSNSWWR